MHNTALAAAGVLQTRPRHQSAALIASIENAGGRAVNFPVLDIAARSRADIDLDMDGQEAADIVIFVSRNAVDHGLYLASSKSLLGAIGTATAEALAAAGQRADIVPAHGFDSESLLAEAPLQNVAGKRVLIVRGNGGRELLGETLRARGALVNFVCVYERRLYQPTAQELDNVARYVREGGIHYLLAMSVASLEALLALLPAECDTLTTSARLVTPSDRVIMAAENRLPGMRRLLASSPDADDLVAAMIADWQRRADETND